MQMGHPLVIKFVNNCRHKPLNNIKLLPNLVNSQKESKLMIIRIFQLIGRIIAANMRILMEKIKSFRLMTSSGPFRQMKLSKFKTARVQLNSAVRHLSCLLLLLVPSFQLSWVVTYLKFKAKPHKTGISTNLAANINS